MYQVVFIFCLYALNQDSEAPPEYIKYATKCCSYPTSAYPMSKQKAKRQDKLEHYIGRTRQAGTYINRETER